MPNDSLNESIHSTTPVTETFFRFNRTSELGETLCNRLKYSANLGFLWHASKLGDAIYSAAQAGFEAVEFHWPYAVQPKEVVRILKECQIPALALNTRPGDREAGEFGLAALPGREKEARDHIDEAIAYAVEIDCCAIHVMAGITSGIDAIDAGIAYRNSLCYACETAAAHQKKILIEPISQHAVPGYHLSTVEAAAALIHSLGHPNLKLLFDCFHTAIMQGNVVARLSRYLSHIEHVQIAAVPDRGEPDKGELDYLVVLEALKDMGYCGYVGAEYCPIGNTEAGLGWLAEFKARLA